jgi:hypothetical protein
VYEADNVLLRTAGATKHANDYYKSPSQDSLEDFLGNEVFPYSGRADAAGADV